MELAGMALGQSSGGVADKLGRRRTVLGCIMVMAMECSATTAEARPTSARRLITGLESGMLA
jgi:hypothetical protein